MRGVIHVALQDVRLQLVDKAAIFFMVLMPLGFIFFFGTVFKGNDGLDMAEVMINFGETAPVFLIFDKNELHIGIFQNVTEVFRSVIGI